MPEVAKSLDELAADGLIDPGWASALEPVAPRIAGLGDFLRAENAAGRGYLPAGDKVLRAFAAPLAEVRVLIVGQDPYPTPGHPIGLSFAVDPHVRPVPRSLANIYRELHDDLGLVPPAHGDLTPLEPQRGHAPEPRAHRAALGPPRRIAARAGRRSPTTPSAPSSGAARRSSRSSGGATRRD